MTISIHYYGQLRQLTGKASEDIAVADSIATCLQQVAGDYDTTFREILFDDTGDLRRSVLILVNDTPINHQAPPALHAGDSITLMSAIAGG